MSRADQQPFYKSSIPFDTARIQTAAVYCSDGRFGNQFNEFMQQGLKLPRYDRLVVPGGAASLASHFENDQEEKGVGQQLKFLIEGHSLERVVLIAHQDCAFYTERLAISETELESIQFEDLKKAIARVQSIGPDLRIDAFFTRKTDAGVVQFESVQ